MDQTDKNSLIPSTSVSYLHEEIVTLRAMLANALGLQFDEIKVSFPSLDNFYMSNNVYKSSWAIYIQNSKLPELLYTGNFLIQGGSFGKRASKSPFGADTLSSLTSVANTFSYDASRYKQNWTLDLSLFDEDKNKLKFSVKEYQEFLTLLNIVRAKWLLHLSEEGNFDFVIIEFSEPSDQLFFMNLENVDSVATKIKTYFKPISQKALNLFRVLSSGSEFEGKLVSLQPGTWLRDDVLIEIHHHHFEKVDEKDLSDNLDYGFNNPFKTGNLRPSF